MDKKIIQNQTPNTENLQNLNQVSQTLNNPTPQSVSSQNILHLSNSSLIRFWLIGSLFVILGYRFYQTLDLIYLIFSALIIAFSIEGIILSMEKKIKNRALSIAISYLALFLFAFS